MALRLKGHKPGTYKSVILLLGYENTNIQGESWTIQQIFWEAEEWSSIFAKWNQQLIPIFLKKLYFHQIVLQFLHLIFDLS